MRDFRGTTKEFDHWEADYGRSRDSVETHESDLFMFT